MLSTSLLQGAAAQPSSSRLLVRTPWQGPAAGPGDSGPDAAPAPVRTRIWEFGVNLHCSIVGTCLSTAELRHVVAKTDPAVAAASDHDLHMRGVALAARKDSGARLLQKALDRKHHAAIARLAKAKDAAAVLSLWDEALKQGDIPGAYWATLTHPATTEDVVKRAFGDIHMLSHLVGAANRADIRRLRALEEANAALAARLERQQRQLHDGFAARDATIRRLEEMLTRRAAERAEAPAAQAADAEPTDQLIRDLDRRLARETARRERSERRVGKLLAAARAHEAERQTHRAALIELDAAERHLAAPAGPQGGERPLDLAGSTLLYVGGRPNQIPAFRALVERAGGRFLHHDGGIEQGSGLLPGLVARADRVAFPVDCISHLAVATIKRVCRQAGKPYVPLRTASLACLLAAMVQAVHAGGGRMSADVPVIYSFEGGPCADGQTLLVRATGFDGSVTSFAIPIDNVKHFIAFLLAWVGTLSAGETPADGDAPGEAQIMPIPATSIAIGAPSGQEGYIGISVGRAELVFALPPASFGPLGQTLLMAGTPANGAPT
jgi:hypothetical protein